MGAAKPGAAFLSAVGMVSASALAYEVLLMRLFSVIQWHHFAYMIISLALLGYGVSGMVLALNRERMVRNFSATIGANIVLFGVAAPLCFLLAQQFQFHPAEMLWMPLQWLNLFAVYLLLAIPFFFAANVIGLAFYYYRNDVSAVYAADLLGAGGGSIAIIVLLNLLFPQKILAVLILSAVVSAWIAWRCGPADRGAEWGAWFGVPVFLGIAALVMTTQLLPLNVSPYKSQPQLLLIPGTQIIARNSSPLGVVSVVNSGITPLRHAPGLSLNATIEPPGQLAVFTDADNMTAITRYEGDP
ncbi:MAG: SAM-dependent methyltransferase, partial [Methylomonas sp.]|nr:SAM-dependent methyltransferase [Methylomonas sp.]